MTSKRRAPFVRRPYTEEPIVETIATTTTKEQDGSMTITGATSSPTDTSAKEPSEVVRVVEQPHAISRAGAALWEGFTDLVFAIALALAAAGLTAAWFYNREAEQATTARDTAVAQTESVSADLEDARARIGKLTSERDAARTDLEAAQDELKAADAEARVLRSALAEQSAGESTPR